MLDHVLGAITDRANWIWGKLTSTPGQLTTGASTFGISYAHQDPSALLSDIGMIASLCLTITLTAVNALRFIKDWHNSDNPIPKFFKKLGKKKGKASE